MTPEHQTLKNGVPLTKYSQTWNNIGCVHHKKGKVKRGIFMFFCPVALVDLLYQQA